VIAVALETLNVVSCDVRHVWL